MKQLNRIAITVDRENRWFLERYLNVFDFVGLFPADALGGEGARGVPVVLHTDRGFDIESDIDRAKLQLRSRSKHRGWMRWTEEHGLREGDQIVLERTGEREYTLSLARAAD